MKFIHVKHHLIIFLLLLHFLPMISVGQLDVQSPDVLIELGIDESDTINMTEALYPIQGETTHFLWTKHNFNDESTYALLIDNSDSHAMKFYPIRDINVIKAIQGEYTKVPSQIDRLCEKKYLNLSLVKNKQIIDRVKVFADCNILITQDGQFLKFDASKIPTELKAVFVEEDLNVNVQLTRESLDQSLEDAQLNDSILYCYSTINDFRKIRFVFEGGVEKLEQVYNDPFYLELMRKRILRQKNSSKFQRRKNKNLTEKELFIEHLARHHTKNSHLELVEWAIYDKDTNDLLITVGFSEMLTEAGIDEQIEQWDLTNYTLVKYYIKN
ncbi:MAG: hypothetical protein P1U56_24895 [Saprospiraceae bacterium]|nr:hypothetical protein [Saprospiraceae bacterium]